MEIFRVVVANDGEPLVNMVYSEVGGNDYEVFGAFSGSCGGMGLFHQSDDRLTVSDDCSEFESKLLPEEVAAVCSELERLRHEFESYDDDDMLVGLSAAGLAFVDDGYVGDDGMTYAFSDGASDDFIYDIQGEWNLDFSLGGCCDC